jgi:hypothetical protein
LERGGFELKAVMNLRVQAVYASTVIFGSGYILYWVVLVTDRCARIVSDVKQYLLRNDEGGSVSKWIRAEEEYQLI